MNPSSSSRPVSRSKRHSKTCCASNFEPSTVGSSKDPSQLTRSVIRSTPGQPDEILERPYMVHLRPLSEYDEVPELLRNNFETDEMWAFRKRFLNMHWKNTKDRFRLSKLSEAYVNNQFFGVRLPDDIKKILESITANIPSAYEEYGGYVETNDSKSDVT